MQWQLAQPLVCLANQRYQPWLAMLSSSLALRLRIDIVSKEGFEWSFQVSSVRREVRGPAFYCHVPSTHQAQAVPGAAMALLPGREVQTCSVAAVCG